MLVLKSLMLWLQVLNHAIFNFNRGFFLLSGQKWHFGRYELPHIHFVVMILTEASNHPNAVSLELYGGPQISFFFGWVTKCQCWGHFPDRVEYSSKCLLNYVCFASQPRCCEKPYSPFRWRFSCFQRKEQGFWGTDMKRLQQTESSTKLYTA